MRRRTPSLHRVITLVLLAAIVVFPSLVQAQNPRPGGPTAGAQRADRSAPGAVVSWARLPRVVQRAAQVRPRLSPGDRQTIERLRRQSFRPTAPAMVATDRAPAPRPARTPQTALAPSLLTGWQGPSSATNQALVGLVRPPDPDVAVGLNHVGVVVNVLFTVYSKTGTQLLQSTLASWFSNVCSNCSPFDPRIAFDPLENRWILIALDQADAPPANVSRILLSVSQTSDPTGSWWNYNLEGIVNYGTGPEATWADYPDVGFDSILSTASPSGAIYITANQFTFGGNAFRTAALRIISKAEAYSGAALNFWTAWDRTNQDGTQAFTLRAAKTYGSSGVEHLVNNQWNTANFVTLWAVVPTYPPTAVNWTRQATINIGAYSLPPLAPQSGCADTLDTIDARLYNAVWRNNRLYTAFAESFDWGAGPNSNVRYLKINTSSNAAEINLSYGASGSFYFMPAITVDAAENIHFVFARSSTSEFANVRYTGHRNGAGAAESSALLHAGVQCITGFRWGDYFGAAVDPALPRRAWVFGQWASDEPGISAVWDWSTWVGQVMFTGTTTVGLYNPTTSTFFLKNTNSAGAADLVFGYGPAGAGWTPIAGDWDGNGTVTVGLYNPTTSTFFLKNTNTAGAADLVFTYGPVGAGWLPVVGDWNGDGIDTIGLYNPTTSTFFLKNANSAGAADLVFGYGPAGAGWTPLAGDWNGDGIDTVGLWSQSTSTFFLRNANAAGAADLMFGYGPSASTWLPRVGDWDANTTDTPGLYNPTTSTFFLRNTNSAGAADLTFGYGPAGSNWTPIVGDWDGQ